MYRSDEIAESRTSSVVPSQTARIAQETWNSSADLISRPVSFRSDDPAVNAILADVPLVSDRRSNLSGDQEPKKPADKEIPASMRPYLNTPHEPFRTPPVKATPHTVKDGTEDTHHPSPRDEETKVRQEDRDGILPSCGIDGLHKDKNKSPFLGIEGIPNVGPIEHPMEPIADICETARNIEDAQKWLEEKKLPKWDYMRR